ncbi:hypothetical protein WJX81_001492 [Elliptochloris bilobata]|uniref:Uncharacterized protein n=1 Tax=Elliptochloris bilobata TaxID=381761 RepID=A0AAW1QMF2_9CHLO
MAVLVVNGQLQPEAPSSAAQLLREVPRGAYTAAVALPGIGVPGWDLHLAARCSLCLSVRQPGQYARPFCPSGCLLEGLVTNLFVVAGVGDGVVEVHTAAPSDGVLSGVMRHHVLQACMQAGILVVEKAPDPAGHRTWREAFLTNCVRSLQPLRRITAPACVWEAF